MNYVALFYVLIIYTAWKRWYHSLPAGGGRKSMKRLQRCAPQVLFRALKNQRYCQHVLQECDAVYCVSLKAKVRTRTRAQDKIFLQMAFGLLFCAFL